jgi:sec-independent protein translocase protein TatC
MSERSQAEMPFLDHLDELRSRLIKSLIALIVGMVIGLIAVAEFGVLEVIKGPIEELLPDNQLIYLSPMTPFLIMLKLGFIAGLTVVFPFLAFQMWAFLSPALYEHERRFVIPAVGAGSLLFVAGVAMAFFVVLPLGLKILLGFQSEALAPMIGADEYLKFATGLMLAFGLMFEMPVVLVFMTLIGILTPETLAKYRRHAIVVMAILSAILTPADPFTMLAMMVPLVLLYESAIFTSRILASRRERRDNHPREGSAA